MTPGIISCALEAPLETVAELMQRHRVHAVVGFGDVTEDDTRLWGLISDLDVVGIAAREGLGGRTAGGAAASEVVTVAPDESLRRAAELMAEHSVAHLLVVDPVPEEPIGVVSTLDVARVATSVAAPRGSTGSAV